MGRSCKEKQMTRRPPWSHDAGVLKHHKCLNQSSSESSLCNVSVKWHWWNQSATPRTDARFYFKFLWHSCCKFDLLRISISAFNLIARRWRFSDQTRRYWKQSCQQILHKHNRRARKSNKNSTSFHFFFSLLVWNMANNKSVVTTIAFVFLSDLNLNHGNPYMFVIFSYCKNFDAHQLLKIWVITSPDVCGWYLFVGTYQTCTGEMLRNDAISPEQERKYGAMKMTKYIFIKLLF